MVYRTACYPITGIANVITPESTQIQFELTQKQKQLKNTITQKQRWEGLQVSPEEECLLVPPIRWQSSFHGSDVSREPRRQSCGGRQCVPSQQASRINRTQARGSGTDAARKPSVSKTLGKQEQWWLELHWGCSRYLDTSRRKSSRVFLFKAVLDFFFLNVFFRGFVFL